MKKIDFSKITLIAIILVITATSWHLYWRKDLWTGIVQADGKGYYAYLPAVFIYKDLNYGFFDHIEKEKYYHPNRYYDYRAHSGYGHLINKYYCGTAVAEMPFFLMAHGFTKMIGGDADGFSKYYMIFVNIAAIFYLFLGLLYLRKTLIAFAIPKWIISVTLIVAVFATNLFTYTVVETGLSHIFSFAFVSAFVYFSKRFFDSPNTKYLPILAALFGMIVLIRPINLLIVLSWPFLAGGLKALLDGLRFALVSYKKLLISMVIIGLIVSIQLIAYKISTGHFIIYSYAGEGFNFLDPHFMDILFSYRKGLFLYTPMYLLAMVGLIPLFKKNKFAALTWLAFFIFITYIFSSWWFWSYGGSFSSRVYVEYIPLFMILFAILLSETTQKWGRVVLVSLSLLLLITCQIQTYQYRYYEIHWDEMNKEKYWDVFMMRNRF